MPGLHPLENHQDVSVAPFKRSPSPRVLEDIIAVSGRSVYSFPPKTLRARMGYDVRRGRSFRADPSDSLSSKAFTKAQRLFLKWGRGSADKKLVWTHPKSPCRA